MPTSVTQVEASKLKQMLWRLSCVLRLGHSFLCFPLIIVSCYDSFSIWGYLMFPETWHSVLLAGSCFREINSGKAEDHFCFYLWLELELGFHVLDSVKCLLTFKHVDKI